MRIGLIGSARFGTDEPFAGGLEAHVATLARHLTGRGHEVQVLPEAKGAFTASATARRDVSAGARALLAEHHAYLSSLLRVGELGVDVLHNHSVHYLPIAMAPALPVPMVTTLHSPPTTWLESAFVAAEGRPGPVVSVSAANAAQWCEVVGPCDVVPNGIDVERFRPGPGGGGHVAWFGRIVPEKGLTSAIAAARAAGLPLRIAGPRHDPAYFERYVRPRLGPDVTYEGHLDARGLQELVGTAEATLVTPHWDEPYGLVVAESLAMGTPVAAFTRGGIPEVVSHETGRLAPPDDVEGLAAALVEATGLDRIACRRHAERYANAEHMVDRYEALYRRCLGEDGPWPR
jgi:glycosyltransferase involved in cell wall biosynthesis